MTILQHAKQNGWLNPDDAGILVMNSSHHTGVTAGSHTLAVQSVGTAVHLPTSIAVSTMYGCTVGVVTTTTTHAHTVPYTLSLLGTSLHEIWDGN